MKNNQPVTQTEIFLDPAKPIVTKTDLKGLITYVNESFIAISGFQREELIGAPHNIVRHPDMPAAAFADLWQTIKAGHPWRGIVKNRSKNGDFYWVEAYVTPITEDGRITGYMSVRTPPSREDVAAAEALYRQVNAGNASLPATHVSPPLTAFNKYLWGTAVLSALLAVLGPVLGGAAGIVCGIGAALAAVVSAALVWMRLVAPLADLEAAIRSIDEGRLNRRIPAVGVIAPLLERLEALRIHQRAIFADVLVSSHEVDAKVHSLDEAMQALMAAAEQQMDQVQKVAAAMEEMSVSISEISSSTEACLDAAVRTEDTAHNGLTSIGVSIDNSRQVAAVVDGSKRKIGEVHAAVARISDISRVIKDIATQTNLLALNAAIEAARAGEHGRGFAIVADEVRKLAESTESSTSEIAKIVGGVVAESEAAVASMVEVATEVNRGVAQIEGNGTALKAIWETSQQSARFNRDITDMLTQQTTTSQEIAINMERISTTLESSNASVASVGLAAHRLRATSEELRRLVSHMESALH